MVLDAQESGASTVRGTVYELEDEDYEDYGTLAVEEYHTQLTAFQQLSEVRAKLSVEMQHRLDGQTDQLL